MNFILQLLAQSTKVNPDTIPDIPPISAFQVLVGILDVIYFAAGATAVVVIILAGYTFSTSVYDPAKIVQAKNAILYAVVGLIVVIFAFVITQFILGRF